MDDNTKERLGSERIGKLLWSLALPTVVAQVINMLYNVVDRIYIGHMGPDGALALTGIGVCLPIILLISAFAALVSSGGAPRASMALGKGEMKEAEEILGGCTVLMVGLSLVLTLFFRFFSRPILLAFGASGNTIGYAVSYMSIYSLGTIFVQMTLGLNGFITAQGKTNVSMFSVLIGAVLNIILDPLFIFVLDMGIQGAATATVISQAVSSLWCLFFLTSDKAVIRLRARNLKFKSKVVLPCVALGASSFIMQSTESIISVCFNSSLLKYGGDLAVGAMTICTSVMQMSMLPLQGIVMGAQPIASFNYGARNYARVRETFRVLLKTVCSVSVTVWLLVQLFPSVFVSIFSSDALLQTFAPKALRIYCGALCIFGVQMSCQIMFVSLGCALDSIIVAVFRKLVLLIPLIFLLPLFLSDKTMAVFTAEVVADVIAVVFTALLFSKEFRKRLA